MDQAAIRSPPPALRHRTSLRKNPPSPPASSSSPSSSSPLPLPPRQDPPNERDDHIPLLTRISMGLSEVNRRVLTELFDLDPVPEPAPSRAEWPAWSNATTTTTSSSTTSTSSNGSDDNRHSKPTAPAVSDVHLRVLSLNAWGLPVAPKCTERAIEIAKAIHEGYDVVVLQEIWHRRERNLLISRAQQSGFHYYHYFQSAVGFPVPLGADSFGTGLLVLSRMPIAHALYHSFSLSGRPYALHEADFIANKGVGLLRLHTRAGLVDVYVTHLLANYNHLGQPGPGDRYLAHRVAQAYELTQFITATSKNPLTIVCGDFNSPPDCMVLRIPRDLHHLRDAFTDTNERCTEDTDHGLTFAAKDNKFSHGEHPMRMDYVLYKMSSPSSSASSTTEMVGVPCWQLMNCSVFKGFFTDAKGEQCPLSDHFGVSAEFVFGAPRDRPLPPTPSLCTATDKTPPHTVNESAPQVSSLLPSALSPSTHEHYHQLEDTEDLSAATSASSHSSIDRQAIQLNKFTEDGFLRSVRCLQDLQHLFLEGRSDAFSRRAAHLRRSTISFLLLLLLLIVHAAASFHVYVITWLVILVLAFVWIAEYVLAFYYVTLECSSFTEMANQVRLHLHAEQALGREVT